MVRNLLFIILLCFILILPSVAKGAVLYLETTKSDYHQGDTFIVEVRVDTEEECINLIEANLNFPQDVLEAVDFSQSNSILTFWIKSPSINQSSGLISFAGGVPGGYCGKIPGDLGESNLLGRIILKVHETIQIERQIDIKIEFLDNSQILLNDGFGTLAKLTTKNSVFTILPGKTKGLKNEWQEELKKDEILPEFFEIRVNQDSAIFEGKYFIIFSTVDQQTGIDYYEIKEGGGDWKEGESPYLLKNQSLRKKILVKAVDKAANERIAEYLPSQKPFPYWIIILILAGIGVIWWIKSNWWIKSKMRH